MIFLDNQYGLAATSASYSSSFRITIATDGVGLPIVGNANVVLTAALFR